MYFFFHYTTVVRYRFIFGPATTYKKEEEVEREAKRVEEREREGGGKRNRQTEAFP